ncbi:2-dehydropantoate 2-reductase [Oikeobacillus pervagus]|uniref:2-dehydropantoate 2-reductase n=1 Tax=Oikeobacillus pervagus TaxID=1325931 RepID=A0AAJ1SYM5_9BACI|nr:2-dehydropantoate 2-reductase [Oikeobacillus pervagus]MDQ0215230.1 2-dehydropantoate 2-reductase [Oikeobacillus pervagus]
MNIGIIGGGSIGMFFSACLHDSFNVTQYTRKQVQADEICQNGLWVEENGGKNRINLQARSLQVKEASREDVLFIAVKQYHLQALETFLCSLPVSIPLIFLQNGMGHLAFLEKLPQQHLFVATIEHGVFRKDQNSIHIRGRGKTNIALFRGNPETIKQIMSTSIKEFPFHWHNQYQKMLLEKLFANAVINPLTAILKVKNGELISNPYYYSLMKQVFSEVANVFDGNEQDFQNIEAICKKTANNRSSMLRDIEDGRPTEIEAIIGYIINEAKKMKRTLPVCTAIYSMICGMEGKEEGL